MKPRASNIDQKPEPRVPAPEPAAEPDGTCQVCGTPRLPEDSILCRACGEPVIVWGWSP